MTIQEAKQEWYALPERSKSKISDLFWNRYHQIKRDARVPRNSGIEVIGKYPNKYGKYYAEFMGEGDFYSDAPIYKRSIDKEDAAWLRKWVFDNDRNFWM